MCGGYADAVSTPSFLDDVETEVFRVMEAVEESESEDDTEGDLDDASTILFVPI